MKTNKIQTAGVTASLTEGGALSQEANSSISFAILKGEKQAMSEVYHINVSTQSGSRKQRHLQGATLEKEELC